MCLCYFSDDNNPFNGRLYRTTRVSQYQQKHALTYTLSFWLIYNIIN